MSKNCKCASNKDKWLISFYSALIFALIASPFMYKITGQLTNMVGIETSQDGCPNAYGLILHLIVFMLIVRLTMNLKKQN